MRQEPITSEEYKIVSELIYLLWRLSIIDSNVYYHNVLNFLIEGLDV